MIRVLLVDDQPIVRYGLKQILTEVNDICVVGEVTTRNEVLHKIHAGSCHVLILDVVLPDLAELGLLSDLQHAYPSLPILMLSIRTETEFSMRALKAGASGHITIDSSPEEFIKAIRMVANGRKYIGPDLAEALAFGLQNIDDQPRHRNLSDREFQVMSLLGAGKTPTETARTLGLGKTTIATYRTRILEKLCLKNSAEIVRYAVEHRLH